MVLCLHIAPAGTNGPQHQLRLEDRTAKRPKRKAIGLGLYEELEAKARERGLDAMWAHHHDAADELPALFDIEVYVWA